MKISASSALRRQVPHRWPFSGRRRARAGVADVVILVAGLGWLIARPGVWPIMLLIGFEGLVLLINLFMLTQVGVEEGFKGIISSVLIRIAAIIFLYSGLRSRRAAAQSGAVPLEQSGTSAPKA